MSLSPPKKTLNIYNNLPKASSIKHFTGDKLTIIVLDLNKNYLLINEPPIQNPLTNNELQ
jgi:hypothetical protein